MAEAGEVRYKAGVDDSGIDGDMQKVQSKLTGAAGIAAKAVGVAFLAVGAAVGAAVKMGVEEGSALEQSIGGIETLFGAGGKSAEEYAKSVGKSVEETKADYQQLMNAQNLALDNASKAYKTAGLSANDYMQTVTGFAASLKQSVENETEAAKIADMAVIDMADNANKMGSSMESIQTAYQGFAKQNYTMLDNLKLGYGGTKQEMQRLLADAQKLTGVKYDINNLADVYEAIHVIQGELGITGTTAAEAAETVSGSFAMMEASFHNLLGALATGGDVETAMQELVDSAMTYLGNLLPMVQEILSGLITGVGAYIVENAPSLLESGKALVDNIITGAQGQLSQLSGIGVEVPQNILTGLSTGLPDLMNAGVDVITNVQGGVLQELPNLITTGGDTVNQLLDAFLTGLPGMLEAGTKLVANLGDGLVQNGPAVFAAIGQVLAQLLSTIISHLPEILAAGVQLIGQLAVGIVQAAGVAVQGMFEVLTQIKNKFSEIDWGDVGHRIVEGVANGIKNGARLIIDAAKEAAKAAFNAAKEFLGIKSPSKLFRDEVGVMVDEGMAQRIRKNTGVVEDAVEDVSGSLFDTAKETLSINADGQDFSYHGTTSIEVPVNLDGREIARGTAVYTDQQLAWESRG